MEVMIYFILSIISAAAFSRRLEDLVYHPFRFTPVPHQNMAIGGV